jgi:hypothetical protein
MDSAEPTVTQQARDRSDRNTLEALRLDWDTAYQIEIADGEWRARRLDGLGGWMYAGSAEELRSQMVADYLMKPVPRQPGKPQEECARTEDKP